MVCGTRRALTDVETVIMHEAGLAQYVLTCATASFQDATALDIRYLEFDTEAAT
jgi:hypothetical protein